MDKEVLLHIIDGPGSGLTMMVLGLFAMIVFLTLIRYTSRHDDAFEKGKEAARENSIERIDTTLSRLVHDVQRTQERISDFADKKYETTIDG